MRHLSRIVARHGATHARRGRVGSPPVQPFVATLAAALIAGLVAREALGLPLVAAMAIALVAGLAADYAVRRRLTR